MGCQNNTLLRSLTNNLSLRGRIRTFHPSAAALLPLFFSFFLFKKKDKYPFFFLCTSFPFSYFFSFSLVCLFLRSSECRISGGGLVPERSDVSKRRRGARNGAVGRIPHPPEPSRHRFTQLGSSSLCVGDHYCSLRRQVSLSL